MTRAGVVVAMTAIGLVGVLAGTVFASSSPTPPRAATSTQRPLATTAVSSARCHTNEAAGTMTFVSPFGYDASAGIIDIFAARALGYFKALCVKVAVDIPSFTTSPYQLVSTGVGTVTGEGSAADDIVQVASGSNLVAVATFADTSDYAVLTNAKTKSLKALEGNTLGYHTVFPAVLSEMLTKAGVKASKVHEVNDTSYDPRLLMRGTFDGLQAYQSNEPFTLEAAGYKKGSAFHEWTPAQFGVKGTFNVQVVNGTFLKAHRATVADFVRADLKAAAYCIAHQDRCVSLEQQAAASGGAGATFDVAHAKAEWRFEAALVAAHRLSGKGIGVQTTSEWTPEARAVVTDKLVAKAPQLAKIEDTTLAAGLYHGTSLVWP